MEDFRAATPSVANKKLKQRRTLARYENPARPILSTLHGVLFREAPLRRAGRDDSPHPLADWWEDVDGTGTTIDEFWAQPWLGAAIFGHVFVVMDRAQAQADTAADAAEPYLRVYTPLDVTDWLTDERGELTAIRALEAVPRTSFDTYPGTTQTQVREIGIEGWRLIGPQGTVIAQGTHDYGGELPVVVLYCRRRTMQPIIGESVLGDPQLYIDAYNLTSEVREILRNQTFSLLNAPLGQGQDALSVEQSKALLGETTGTENVLFSGLPLQYVSPDAAQVEAYMAERDGLLRTIYRLASVPWESDNRDAESADSQKIKRDEFYAAVSRYAQELERADYAVCELYLRAEFGDRWEQEWERAELTIQWPTQFESSMQTDLEQATLATGLGLPKPAQDALKKGIIPKLLPSLNADELAEIYAAIDAQEDPSVVEAREREAKIAVLAQGPARMSPAQAAPEAEDEDEDDAEEAPPARG